MAQLRTRDDIPVRLLLDSFSLEFGKALDQDSRAYVDLLDRAASLLVLFIQLEDDRLVKKALAAFGRAFDHTFGSGAGHQRSSSYSTAAQLQLICRILAAGAFAVRQRQWQAVRALVLEYPERLRQMAPAGMWTNWFRYVHVQAARQNFIDVRDQGSGDEVSLFSMVMTLVRNLPLVRPDLTDSEGDLDAALTSLVQFDVLGSLVVLGNAPGDRDFTYYPHFGRYYPQRWEPILTRLVSEKEMREALHPGDDATLRRDVSTALEWARHDGFRYGGSVSYSDPTLAGFLSTTG